MITSEIYFEPNVLKDNIGYVRLVDAMGSDLSVVRSARVSYDAPWRAGNDEKSDEKLLRYLMTHEHGTPLESCTFTFEIKAPIMVLRQWHRHRTQSYNELSLRYKEVPSDEFYIPDASVVGLQSKSNKQGRDTTGQSASIEEDLLDVKHHSGRSYGLYQKLLTNGWPRELARMVMGVNLYSHMFTTMNLRNFYAFTKLRLDGHAQWEIRMYARAMAGMIALRYPVCSAVFKEMNPQLDW